MKEILSMFVAIIPIGVILKAIAQKYAEKNGIEKDSPDAVLEPCKAAIIRLILAAIVIIPFYGIMMVDEQGRELYGGWLEPAKPYLEVPARFLPGFFAFFMMLYLAVAILYLILWLFEDKDGIAAGIRKKIREKAKSRFVFMALFFALLVIVGEFYCIAAKSTDYVTNIFSQITWPNTVLYATLVAYFACFGYLLYACYGVFKVVPKIPGQFKRKFGKKKKGKTKRS